MTDTKLPESRTPAQAWEAQLALRLEPWLAPQRVLLADQRGLQPVPPRVLRWAAAQALPVPPRIPKDPVRKAMAKKVAAATDWESR
ncbi:hypothetical protein [Acidovorax sp.]|uniref:hypothetical protein n=1 Tax=Acidovorax sp. TaxID=1872122 RepID=UPI00391F14C0